MTRSASRRWVLAILLAAAVSRLGLALLGGQHHYGDEVRYFRGAFATFVLMNGQPHLLDQFGASSAHTGFTLIAGALAPAHWALAKLYGAEATDAVALLWATPRLGAALLGLFSTLNLWLLYRLARRYGADREEALWGLLLAAAALSLALYARHLLPYDASLCCLLLSLWLGLSLRSPARLAGSGALAGFGFTVYNGHWHVVPLVALALVWAARRRPEVVRLGAAWVAGAAAGLALGYSPVFFLGEQQRFLGGIGTFAATIRDGEFAEGWSLPWEWLWHAEGGLGVVALALALWAGLRPGASPRARGWLLAAAALYAALVAASVGAEKFVVYARTTRPLVPCLALAAGAGLAALLARAPRWRAPVAAGIVLAAALNLAPLFPQDYPVDVDDRVHRAVGGPREYLTFVGSWDKREHVPETRPDLLLVNTYALFGFLSHRDYPAGEVIFDVPHPLALTFYQYDGHSAAQRALLRAHPPRMQLLRAPTAPVNQR